MEQSLYLNEVNKYFPGVAANVVERLNDTTNPLSFLHRQMLTKDYSTNMKWESILNVNRTIVAADVVAMDSSLPLKRRDALATAHGDIPKMGMEMQLRETELTQLDIIRRTPGRNQQFLARLFEDTQKVIAGMYERLEYEFLLGLSSGVCVVSDANNVGTGIRVDYGYLNANKFGVSKLWSDPTSTPFSDIANRVLAKAGQDGNAVRVVMMDLATFNNIAKTAEARELLVNSLGIFYPNAVVPTPTLGQLNNAIGDRYGYQIQIVDRNVRVEKNGVQTSLKPWATGQVIFLGDTNVGSLVWSTLAEMNHPVNNVNYTTVDDFILVSKFRLNRPSLSEHTTSQALVLPVISGINAIYKIDSLTVQA